MNYEKLAFAHAHRFWLFLHRLYPEDFHQTVKIAAWQAPSAAKLGNAVNRGMNRLARDMGWRRAPKWIKEAQIPAGERGVKHGRMIWRTSTNNDKPTPSSETAEDVRSVRKTFRLKDLQGMSEAIRCKLLQQSR